MPQDLIRRALMKIDKNYLPYEYFERLEDLEEVRIIEGVVFKKLPTDKDLYFFTKLEKGTTLIEHYHNAKEYFFIKKGRIILNDYKELKGGDKFTLKPFTKHNIKVLEDSEMFIQFEKDAPFKEIK